MTQHWKLKTNTVNSLLVLVILILVKAGWTDCQNQNLEPRKLTKTPEQWTTNNLTNPKIKSAISSSEDLSISSNHTYLNRWDRTQEFPIVDEEYVKNLTINSEEFPDAEDEFKDPQLYESDINSFYGESVADTLFHSSTNNISLIFTDLSKCLYDFNFITCLKMLLLNRVNNMLFLMEKNNLTKTDLYLLDGYVAFKLKNETEEDLAKVEPKPIPQPDLESKEDNEINDDDDDERYLSLDQELSEKVLQLFKNRSLRITLLPGFGLDIKPLPKKKGEEFVCFSTRTFIAPNFNRTAIFSQMRKAVSKDGGGGGGGGGSKNKNKNKNKDKGGFSMMPMMMIPQMIMLGFMPFALANLKMMVMNAFMMNTMALNSAIFMTIRNLIFGPRGGPKIKYVNYGYKNKIKSKKPEVILHSPAAFVKQPEIHKKPPKHVTIISNSYSHNLPSSGPHHESAEDFSGPYPPSSQYSSEADDSFDYDHSGPQHGGLDEPQLGLSNNKYGDDSYGEFSNNHKNVAGGNKYKTIIIRKKNANRRKTGHKPERIRIKKRPGKIPTEVKNIVDQYMKTTEKKNIPLHREKNHYTTETKNRYRTTTLAPISEEEESEENTSQDLTQPIQPTNLYHPITSYYYPNKSPYDSYNYPQNYKTTERTNTWSVPAYAQPIQPSSNPISYNNYYGNSPSTPALNNQNFQEPEYPDYNFDILKVMPNVRNQIYNQKPVTEKNNYSDYLSKLYGNQNINKNQIDRISTNGENNFRNDHQISTDYRTVFSSKYNKDHVNFDKHSDNRHKNHNYSRL